MLWDFVKINTDLAGMIFLIIVSLFVVIILYAVVSPKRYDNLPPGPRPYPIIGNILQVKPKNLPNFIEKCRKKYGDVFCLYLFHKRMIVLNGLEAIHDALINPGDFFSEKMDLGMTLGKGIVFANGTQMKANRKFAVQALRRFGMGQNSIQVKIKEEIEVLLSVIESNNEEPFDIKPLLKAAIANIVSSIIFGKRFLYNDKTFIKLIKNIEEIVDNAFVFKGPDFLRHIPGDPFRVQGTKHVQLENNKLFRSIIDKHIEDYDKHDIRDIIDAYIEQMDMMTLKGEALEENKRRISYIANDMFVGGIETTVTTLLWGLVCLLGYRDIQNKVYHELQRVILTDRLPDYEDRSKLAYLEATVMEILRRANLGPASLPRVATRDCTFRGFTIPKDSIITSNLDSLAYNEKYWNDPMKFYPERFLDKEGVIIQKRALMPFLIGHRSCIGEQLARMELFLFLGSMVQRFKFLPPKGEEPPSLDNKLGLTRLPKPYLVRAIKRYT